MAFISGRCPNCGGEIHLDDSKDKGFCLHCGSPIQVREAVARLKVEHSGAVQMTGMATDDSLVKRGFIELENGDYNKALTAFDEALNINPENYMAWKGKFEARRVNYRDYVKYHGGVLVGVYWCPCIAGHDHVVLEIMQWIENAVRFTPADKQKELKELKDRLITKPLAEISKIEQWQKSGLCCYCGGKISILGNCKTCQKSNKNNLFKAFEELGKKYPLF